jgi:DNA-binding transcriptional ArsR family regulator
MKTDHVQLMKMMGNVHCLKVLLQVVRERRSLDDLVAATGYTATNISYHLKRLRDKGVIEGDRIGHQVFYDLAGDQAVRRFVVNIAATFAHPRETAQ